MTHFFSNNTEKTNYALNSKHLRSSDDHIFTEINNILKIEQVNLNNSLNDVLVWDNITKTVHYKDIITINPFDQDLNTTDNVQFNQVDINGTTIDSNATTMTFDHTGSTGLIHRYNLVGESAITNGGVCLEVQNRAAGTTCLRLISDTVGGAGSGSQWVDYLATGGNQWSHGHNVSSNEFSLYRGVFGGPNLVARYLSNDTYIGSGTHSVKDLIIREVSLIEHTKLLTWNSGTGSVNYREVSSLPVGNPFDQSLNTTDNVQFNNLTSEVVIYDNDVNANTFHVGYRTENDSISYNFGSFSPAASEIANLDQFGNLVIKNDFLANKIQILNPAENATRENHIVWDPIIRELEYKRVIPPSHFNIGCFNNATETVITVTNTQYPLLWSDLNNVAYANNQTGFTQLNNTSGIVKNNYLVPGESAIVKFTYHLSIKTVNATLSTFEVNLKTSINDTDYTVNVPLSYTSQTTEAANREYQISNSFLLTYSDLTSAQLFIANKTNTNNIIIEDCSILTEFKDFV